MVYPIEPDEPQPRIIHRDGSVTPRPPRVTSPRTDVRYLIQCRMHELAEQLLSLDSKWHKRVESLQSKNTPQYHIDNDVILRNLGGATKVVSDMLAAMSAYIQATRD